MGGEEKGRRMIKMQFSNGRWYHLAARDVAAVLEDLKFSVTDVREQLVD